MRPINDRIDSRGFIAALRTWELETVTLLSHLAPISMIIIARRYGRLGNRLILFAHLIAAAREYNVPLLNPCFAEYAKYFPATRDDPWCRYDPTAEAAEDASFDSSGHGKHPRRAIPANVLNHLGKLLSNFNSSRSPINVIRLRDDQSCDLGSDEFAARVGRHRFLLTHGWLFRSERLLEKHASAIREHFQLPPDQQHKINKSIEDCRQQCDVLVGVHIRRGDYARFQNGRFYFSDSVYRRWMHQIAEQYGNRKVRFLVCSDDEVNPAAFRGLDISTGPGNLIDDMYTLAKTDWIVGPPSTFSLWSSLMGQVDVHYLSSPDESIKIPSLSSNYLRSA